MASRQQTKGKATSMKSLLLRLMSALCFGVRTTASAPTARSVSLQPSVGEEPAAAGVETQAAQLTSASEADPPTPPAASALRTPTSMPAASSSSAAADELRLVEPVTEKSAVKITPAAETGRAAITQAAKKDSADEITPAHAATASIPPESWERPPAATAEFLDGSETQATRQVGLSAADPSTSPGAPAPRPTASATPATSSAAVSVEVQEAADGIVPSMRAPPTLNKLELPHNVTPVAPPPLPVAAVDRGDEITPAEVGAHTAAARMDVARAKSGARSSSGTGSASRSGAGGFSIVMHIDAPASTLPASPRPPASAEAPPSSRVAKASGVLAPLRRRQTAGGGQASGWSSPVASGSGSGSGSGFGSGAVPRRLRPSDGSPRSAGRLQRAGLLVGLRLLVRGRSSRDVAGAGGATAAAPKSGCHASPRRLPRYGGYSGPVCIENRRLRGEKKAAAEEDRRTVRAAEHSMAPVSSLMTLWERKAA